MESSFQHERYKPVRYLLRPRELLVVCEPMRSNVNLSRIVRVASCCGLERIVVTGTAKVEKKIARDGADTITIESHRTIEPVLEKLRKAGYRLVGVEQATNSQDIHGYAFERRTALVVGNERVGIRDQTLAMLDDVVEIPVWGLPYSYNAATATIMALYEYCRQYPQG